MSLTRRPFNAEKIERFAQFLELTEDDKAQMYDLASHENDRIPHDLEELLKYEKIGEMALFALRQSKAGDVTESDWEDFFSRIAENKARRGGGNSD